MQPRWRPAAVNRPFPNALVSGSLTQGMAMQRLVKLAFFSTLLTGAALLSPTPAAYAAGHDGIWAVSIITEKGTCDRGYRYQFRVTNGHVTYDGDSAINLDGTVAPDGATQVSIKFGNRGASGTGHLSADSGAGVWHGTGASGSCAGRWEATLLQHEASK